jgi:sulfur relay (sulfurtransferase) DsrF/TusC family protein
MGRFNKNIYWPILLAILCLLPLACETDSCLHGTGSTTRQYVETGFFHHLNVKGIFHIILVQDTAYYVEFEGGDKVLDYVSAVNTDSILWLDNTNRCFYLRSYEKIKAYVHFSHLNKIDLFEVSLVESMNPLDSLYYMTVQGKMAEVNIELNSTRFGFYNNTTTGDYTPSVVTATGWIAAYIQQNLTRKS